MNQGSTPLTPADQMRRIREMVLNVDAASSQDAYRVLASYFSRMDTLHKCIGDLEGKMLIKEPPPGSRLPVIGPLMHRFREIAYRVALRWYNVPILMQQNQFNMSATQTLREIAMITESIASLVKEIDARLTHLEAKVGLQPKREE